MQEFVRNALQLCGRQEKDVAGRFIFQNDGSLTDVAECMGSKSPSLENTADTLLRMLELKDGDLYAHVEHVTEIGLRIADAMQLTEEQKKYVLLGGLFHDIGKIAIHGNILYKKGKLDLWEYDEIKNHPVAGAKMLEELEFSRHVCNIVLQHHERMDGRGYPAGIAGTDILLEARIIAVADSFDALIADRVYRKGMSRAEAVAVLHQGSGAHYDTDIVKIFTARVLDFMEAANLPAG